MSQNGGVQAFGGAHQFNDLPGLGVTPSRPVIGIVPTADQQGYWLIGSEGGIFAFGDAGFVGSLPGSGRRGHQHRRGRSDQGLKRPTTPDGPP